MTCPAYFYSCFNLMLILSLKWTTFFMWTRQCFPITFCWKSSMDLLRFLASHCGVEQYFINFFLESIPTLALRQVRKLSEVKWFFKPTLGSQSGRKGKMESWEEGEPSPEVLLELICTKVISPCRSFPLPIVTKACWEIFLKKLSCSFETYIM